MKHNTKEIIFIQKNVFNQSEYLKIEIKDNKNIIKYSLNNSASKVYVDNDKISAFLEQLFRTTYNWEKKYINNINLDSSIWQLKIVYTNDIERNYFGENDFPNNFEHFIYLKENLLA